MAGVGFTTPQGQCKPSWWAHWLILVGLDGVRAMGTGNQHLGKSPFKATDGALIRGERRTYGSCVDTSLVLAGSHATLAAVVSLHCVASR